MSKLSAFVTATKTIAKAPIKNPYVGRLALNVSKHAPSILVYGGVIGMVATTGFACKEIFESQYVHAHASGDRIKMRSYCEKNPDSEEAQTLNKDIAKSYAKEAIQHIKIMRVPLGLGALSIVSILAGHGMLKRRHAALGVAYMTLKTHYDEYRSAVIDHLGEDVERELRETIAKDLSVEKEDGTLRTPTSAFSPYAKLFQDGNPNFTDDATFNIMFLRNVQNHLNDRLVLRATYS